MATLPNNASIEQVAKVFGVADELGKLTPAARKLTKGQMITLLGANSNERAVELYVNNKMLSPGAIVELASQHDLRLTVADVRSVEAVFGSEKAFPMKDRAVLRSRLAAKKAAKPATGQPKPPDTSGGGTTIWICCCPCCCATAVLEPTRPAVA